MEILNNMFSMNITALTIPLYILFILSRNTNCANLCFSIWSWQVLLWQLTWITLSFHPCLVTGEIPSGVQEVTQVSYSFDV